jgi:signal transduction histidine kinase
MYTTENGLPSNGIKGLQWDDENQFLWIATEAGIVRFNGIDFKVFSKESLAGSQLERVGSIIKNTENKIYAFDDLKQVYAVEKNKIQFKAIDGNPNLFKILKSIEPQQLPQPIIASIAEELKNKNLFTGAKIISTKNNCWIFDEKTDLHFFSVDNEKASHIVFPSLYKRIFKIDKQIFLQKKDGSFCLIDSVNKISNFTTSIVDENNLPFILPEKSILYWTMGMQNPIVFIHEKAWLLTYQNNKIVASAICNTVPTNLYIRFVQYDKKGQTLFIGTDSKGIVVITKNQIQAIKNKSPNIIDRNSYYSQIKLNENTILTNEGDIISDAIKKNVKIPIQGNFSFRTSASNDSTIWLQKKGTANTSIVLYSFNTKKNKLTQYPKILMKGAITVTELNKKVYLVTTKGVAFLEGDSLHYIHLYQYPLSVANEPFDVCVNNDKELLFATCKNLFRFSVITKKVDTLFASDTYCIRTLKKWGSYYFLGSYGGGFFIYKNGVTKSIPIDKNKFLLFTHCFSFDSLGYCWLSTNRGLFKAKTNDLINAFEKNTSQIYYHYLGKNNGMDITELNGGCSPCAVELNKEIISFPTMDGLAWVNTAKPNIIFPEGNILIDNFIINNNTYIDFNNRIELSANTKDILIQIAYSAWCNKENIYLDYKLNDNEDWQALDIKNESIIKLSNLPYGTYNLQIRKLNGFGTNNYVYQKIEFTIKTPWQKQNWFYFLIVVFSIGLFIMFYQIRTHNLKRRQLKLERQVAQKTNELLLKNNELEKNNDINTRLISIISHDIITPLKFLNVAGKNLLQKKSLMTEELKDETIKEITTTSKELQLLSTNILNWIKYQNENRRLIKENFYLHELVNQVFGVLQSLAHQKNIILKNNIPASLILNEYNEPLRILIYNLITNAINFSDKGSIIVDVTTNEKIQISVTDEGVGMTKEQIANIMSNEFIISSANIDNKKGNGLGYLIIKDLLKMMEATLAIQSSKGKGTNVLVTLQNTPIV